MMILIGCERKGSTRPPPKIHQKVAPPTQKIALFLNSSAKTSMICQKKNFFEDQQHAPLRLLSLVLVKMCGKVKTFLFFSDQSVSPCFGSLNNFFLEITFLLYTRKWIQPSFFSTLNGGLFYVSCTRPPFL